MIGSKVGIGFRRQLASDILKHDQSVFSFVELAPENWMQIGGRYKQLLDAAAQGYPLACHGLSLSIGSKEPVDKSFLKALKGFFDLYQPFVYSEHLSYSKVDNAHLYDLLPLPFTYESIHQVVENIQVVQEELGRELAIENVSYYTPVAPEMSEQEFICEVVKRSGCKLLLDVNNVYVNAFNHGYSAKEFLLALPLDKVVYIHMAGHEKQDESLIIDTHGKAIDKKVFELLSWIYPKLPPVPVLLERDFNHPDFSELLREGRALQEIVTPQKCYAP